VQSQTAVIEANKAAASALNELFSLCRISLQIRNFKVPICNQTIQNRK